MNADAAPARHGLRCAPGARHLSALLRLCPGDQFLQTRDAYLFEVHQRAERQFLAPLDGELGTRSPGLVVLGGIPAPANAFRFYVDMLARGARLWPSKRSREEYKRVFPI